MRIERYDGDLVVRLPSDIVEELRLEAGDEVEVRAAGPGLIEITRVLTDNRIISFEVWLDAGDDEASRTP